MTKSTATYAYDTSDRLVSVTEGGKTTTYTYDANGNRASQTVDNVTTTYTYNKANLVAAMTNTMGDVVISSFVYTYYADGNMYTKAETQLTETANTTYVYDGMGRLKSETVGEDVISYYYDANGNRTLMNNDGNITSYTYDKNNRLLTESANGETTTYTYDANGNTLTAGDKTYTYNSRGQQIGYTDGTVTATYAYNPSGLRTAKTVGGSTKYFVYNGMQIVFEYEDSISDGTTYYYGLNRTHSSDGDVFVYNAHGDTVQLVNDNAVVVSYTYDAFGNLTNTIGTSDNAFLYCSEYFDSETQTYYLRARYYNPANGRFNAEDTHWNAKNRIYGDNPIKMNEHEDALELNQYTFQIDYAAVLQSENLYVYCWNNPIANRDFTGKWTISTGYSFSAFVVSGVSYSINLSFDDNGNVAVQVSTAEGVNSETAVIGLASVSLSRTFSVTDRDTVDDLNGATVNLGGSANVCGPVSIGGDVMFLPYDYRGGLLDTSITGIMLDVGIGWGTDVHATQTQTDTKFEFNVIDLVKDIISFFSW